MDFTCVIECKDSNGSFKIACVGANTLGSKHKCNHV